MPVIGLVDVFDDEVIKYKVAYNAACHVVPDTWRVEGQEVDKLREALFKAFVRDIAGLGEALHSLADLD